MLEIIEWLHDRLTRQSYQQSTTIAIIKTTATILTRGTLISIVIYFYALLRYCLMRIWKTLLVFFANGLSTIKFSHKFSHRMRQYNTVFPSKLGFIAFIASIECNFAVYFFLHFRASSSLDDVNTLKTTQLIVNSMVQIFCRCVCLSSHNKCTTNSHLINFFVIFCCIWWSEPIYS